MKKIILLFIVIFVQFNLLFAQEVNSNGITENIPKENIYKISGELFPIQINADLMRQTKGITETTLSSEDMKVIGTLEPTYVEYVKPKKDKDRILTDYSDWLFTDSVFVSSYLAGGENIAVKFNVKNRKLELFVPNNPLTTEAKEAASKVPGWIRSEFMYVLSKLSNNRMNEFADIINNAEEHLIDEIAFSIAYSSPAFLSSIYCYPQLFLENAQLIYAHDNDLDYVEVVDYGTPNTDDNYYSTVKYWKIDSLKGKIQIEVPKDIYYMYIVHPKITDEIPTYINPELVETNMNGVHINNIAAPPTGVFWRDYLYTHTEPIPDTTDVLFPILKDSVSVCDVIWDDNNEKNQALKAITQWVRDVMDFTSKQERPHQPVRIYDLHIGRCGEHQDLTAAASRACLIPCRGINAYSIDHVWNEFWDEEWEQWEPVNNAYKRDLAYITWDTMGAVTARQSCGVHEYVTNKYNDNHNSRYTITALDAQNNPIDGAELRIYSNRYVNGQNYIVFDTYGITDNNGKYTFVLGKDKLYYIQLKSSLGNNPPESNRVLRLNTSYSSEGQDLSYIIKAPKSIQSKLTNISLPEDLDEDFVINIDFKVEKQSINWKILTNDLGGETTFDHSNVERNINLVIADEDNYNKYLNGESYNAYKLNSLSEKLSFDVPKDRDWYIFLNNEMVNNLLLVDASFSLYRHPTVGVDNKNDIISSVSVYPNPFSTSTIIKYYLESPNNVRISIYNHLGNRIAILTDEFQDVGEHQVVFDDRDFSTGIYYYSIQTSDRIISGKLYLTK